jgi:hypothetical protein
VEKFIVDLDTRIDRIGGTITGSGWLGTDKNLLQ